LQEEKVNNTGKHLLKETNPKNFANLTPEERRRIASNGGKKSVEAKRRKKSLREAADALLAVKVKDQKMRNKMSAVGIKGSDMDNQMALVFAQFIKALGGSTRAAEFLADILGERQIVESKNNNNIDEQDDPLTSSIKEMLGIQELKEDE
jgi:hypothetical protein